MKVLVVGAGISGAVVARELAEVGVEVLVIDKRDHIGGNCYDETINNVLIHRYGPHIFHTSIDFVFNWIKRFADWIPYKHKVKALLENGQYVTVPVNKETVLAIGGGGEKGLLTLFSVLIRKKCGECHLKMYLRIF